MSEDLKSSAHIWDGRPAATEESPPAYIGPSLDQEDETVPEQSTSTPIRQSRRSGQRATYDPLKSISALALIPYHKYNIDDGILSKDKATVTVKQTSLFSQPRHLAQFVLEQARLPPRPILRIIGRRETNVDFDITLNLTHLMDIRNYRCKLQSAQTSPLQNSHRTLRANDDPLVSTHIISMAKRFCNDRSENKSITLTRSIEGVPTDMLAGQVRNLAAAIRYRGVLRIDFIYERSRVVVHKEPSGWFSSILRLHSEQKYDVLESVWSLGNNLDQNDDVIESDVGLRIGHEWWASWNSTIRNAMIRRYKGGVGIDEWIEAKMGHTEQDPTQDWGQDYAL